MEPASVRCRKEAELLSPPPFPTYQKNRQKQLFRNRKRQAAYPEEPSFGDPLLFRAYFYSLIRLRNLSKYLTFQLSVEPQNRNHYLQRLIWKGIGIPSVNFLSNSIFSFGIVDPQIRLHRRK